MAGDWVTMKTGLTEKPAFMQLSDALGLSTPETLGLLYQCADWFQRYGHYGKLKIEPKVLDLYLCFPGVSAALIQVGWLKHYAGVTTLHGFCTTSANRKRLSPKLRRRVLASGRCAKCGSTEQLQVDHIIPIVLGGSCHESNLQPLCAPCNRSKWRSAPAVAVAP